ncbi:MAG TPA: 50S ribosomal protein L17 [Bacteroidetes bacterium]|nr:50S ribosomal protein L17 [Bacteroidota bacterium]
MRHRKGFNHLGRTSAHRKAMLSNMASSLILHKRITTTTAKAKALRSYIEPLITKSKDDTTHSRRVVFSYLKNKFAVAELFREVSPKVMERPGGYTRILKTGNRLGDNAEMCIIELVDYNENMLEDTTKKTKSTRRRRGSGKGKTETPAAAKAQDKSRAVADIPADEEDIQSVTDEGVMEDETSTSASGEAADDKKAEDKGEEVKAEVAETVSGAAMANGEAETEVKEEESESVDKEEDKKE